MTRDLSGRIKHVVIAPDAPLDNMGVLTPRVIKSLNEGHHMFYMGKSDKNKQRGIFSAVAHDLEKWQKSTRVTNRGEC